MRRAVLPLAALFALMLPAASEAGPGYRGGAHRYHHHHRAFTRVFVAAPLIAYPRYYAPAPAYYAPPAPVYIEQPPAASAGQGDWYYCPSARGYYPQVPTCAEPWVRVAPRLP